MTFSTRGSDTLQVSADNETITVQGAGLNDYTLTFLWSLTTTLYVIGGMFGAFCAGFLADKVGRQVFLEISFIYCIPSIQFYMLFLAVSVQNY